MYSFFVQFVCTKTTFLVQNHEMYVQISYFFVQKTFSGVQKKLIVQFGTELYTKKQAALYDIFEIPMKIS